MKHKLFIKRFDNIEKGALAFLLFSMLISISTTVAIVIILGTESYPLFQKISFVDFITGTNWAPLFYPPEYGVLPLVCGTFLIVVGAAIFAFPIGLSCSLYIGFYASDSMRRRIKPILEILAGIPTVVYGYFALTFISPLLKHIFSDIGIFNALSASIVVGIMILPMIISLCDDTLKSVPRSLAEGAYALGGTKSEVILKVMVPAALSGIVSSFILALSRAVGETMAVTLAAGATPQMTFNPLESIQTMTAYIVQVSLGDTPAGSIAYETIFAIGALLFIITLIMNLLSQYVLNRFRELYE